MKNMKGFLIFLILYLHGTAGLAESTDIDNLFPNKIIGLFKVDKKIVGIQYPIYTSGNEKTEAGTEHDVNLFQITLERPEKINNADLIYLMQAIKTGRLEIQIWHDKQLISRVNIENQSESPNSAKYQFMINNTKKYKADILFHYKYNGGQIVQPFIKYNY